MEFVDDQIFHGNGLAPLQPPVKVVLYDPGAVAVLCVILASPLALTGDCAGVRIEQDLCLVEAEPFFFIIGTVQPVGVLELLHVQTEHDHGVDEADLIVIRKFQGGERFLRFPVEEEQFAGRRPVGLDGKVHPARNDGGAEETEKSGAHLESGDIIQRF